MSQLHTVPTTGGEAAGPPVRVAICESNSIASELLHTALSRTDRFQVVGCVTNSQRVVETVNLSPDVMLISSRLEDGPLAGFIALRTVQQKKAAARCVILLDDWAPELVVEAFRAGAAGVFNRGDSFHHLCRCITVVHEGQIWASTAALKYMIHALERGAPMPVTNAKGAELLTRREQEVVSLVADGLSNRDISEHLKLSEHTVKNHLFHIFEKLGISSRVELVLYIVSQRERLAA